MNREKSKNYFENKITTQPFENAANNNQQAVSVPDITQSPGGVADPIYQTKEKPFVSVFSYEYINLFYFVILENNRWCDINSCRNRYSGRFILFRNPLTITNILFIDINNYRYLQGY